MRFAALVLAASTLAACVTDTNRCVPGYRYSPAYDACTPIGAASPDAQAPREAGSASSDGEADAASAGDGGLGNPCSGSVDCVGRASYCLKDPTAAPTDPGICSIPSCTAADCTTAYSCCDCTEALISALMAWPQGVCAPVSDVSTLVSFGCHCL